MTSFKATGHDEERKVKTPAAPPTKYKPPPLLSCSKQTPCDTLPPSLAGPKRQRSPSPLGSYHKRQRFLSEPPSNLTPLRPDDNRHCANCEYPCWLCHISSEPLLDLPTLHVKDNPDYESMNPPSEQASDDSTLSGNGTPSAKKRKICETNGLKYVGPRDADFETYILAPCGMNLDGAIPSDLRHTDTSGAQSQRPSSRVFICKDQEELQGIIEDFVQYKRRRYDEQALIARCNDSILLRDRDIKNDLSNASEIIKSVRRDKWKPRKPGPPMPPGWHHTYDWDIEPDATYAVSITVLDVENRKKLRLNPRQRWLAEDNAVCPYLTIEFKCAEKTGKLSHATCQSAAASMIWLYQRKQIRDALGESIDDLRHYTIIILDAEYIISEVRLKESGYEMTALADGNLTKLNALEEYIGWSNAIHAWGLGPNARSFKEDIRKLLLRERVTQPVPMPEATRSLDSGLVPTPPTSREDVQTDLP